MTKKQFISGIPYSIAFVYMLVSTAYIMYSDKLVMAVAGTDSERIQTIQTEKGIAFVILSGIVLLLVIRRSIKIVQSYEGVLYARERQKQQLMAESESKYLTLFNTIPQPVWIFDEETLTILQVNDAACTMYGYTHAEYSNMTLHHLRPPGEIQVMKRVIAAIRGHERNRIPYPLKHSRKDGSILYVRIENVRVVFNGRKARLAIGTDVSEDLKMKQELTVWNERLRSAHKLSGMGYWTRNVATNEIFWSPELYEIFGVTPDTFQLTETNIARIFSEDRNKPIDLNAELWNGANVVDMERHVMREDGTKIWIHERILPHRNDNGVIETLEGIVIDITSTKEYEQRISESNERLRMVMRATVEAIIDWDIVNNKVYLGNGFRQYFGYTEHEDNYRIWADNILEEDRERIFTTLRERLGEPQSEEISAQYRFKKADGTIAWVAHKGICLRDAQGKAIRVVSAMIDVTQQREYVQQIEQQNDALRDIAFLQSHVVRAPLATLMGLVTLLRQTDAVTEETAVFLSGIDESARKLDAVIHNIARKTEDAESTLIRRGPGQ